MKRISERMQEEELIQCMCDLYNKGIFQQIFEGEKDKSDDDSGTAKSKDELKAEANKFVQSKKVLSNLKTDYINVCNPATDYNMNLNNATNILINAIIEYNNINDEKYHEFSVDTLKKNTQILRIPKNRGAEQVINNMRNIICFYMVVNHIFYDNLTININNMFKAGQKPWLSVKNLNNSYKTVSDILGEMLSDVTQLGTDIYEFLDEGAEKLIYIKDLIEYHIKRARDAHNGTLTGTTPEEELDTLYRTGKLSREQKRLVDTVYRKLIGESNENTTIDNIITEELQKKYYIFEGIDQAIRDKIEKEVTEKDPDDLRSRENYGLIPGGVFKLGKGLFRGILKLLLLPATGIALLIRKNRKIKPGTNEYMLKHMPSYVTRPKNSEMTEQQFTEIQQRLMRMNKVEDEIQNITDYLNNLMNYDNELKNPNLNTVRDKFITCYNQLFNVIIENDMIKTIGSTPSVAPVDINIDNDDYEGKGIISYKDAERTIFAILQTSTTKDKYKLIYTPTLATKEADYYTTPATSIPGVPGSFNLEDPSSSSLFNIITDTINKNIIEFEINDNVADKKDSIILAIQDTAKTDEYYIYINDYYIDKLLIDIRLSSNIINNIEGNKLCYNVKAASALSTSLIDINDISIIKFNKKLQITNKKDLIITEGKIKKNSGTGTGTDTYYISQPIKISKS